MMTLSDIHERIADTIDEWHETAKRATKALESIAESLSKLQTLSEDLRSLPVQIMGPGWSINRKPLSACVAGRESELLPDAFDLHVGPGIKARPSEIAESISRMLGRLVLVEQIELSVPHDGCDCFISTVVKVKP